MSKCSLLVIASISSNTNMTLIQNNIAHFDPQEWKCLILGYSNRTDYPTPRCDAVINPNTRWGEILHLNSVTIRNYNCHTYMLMLDDVNLLNLDIKKLDQFSQKNDVDIASPAVIHASWSFMQPKSKLTHVPHIEIFSTLFNQRAWTYFQRLLAYLPGIGWGYDICLGMYFKNMIDHSQIVQHMKHRSIVKYTQNASKECTQLKQWCNTHPPSKRLTNKSSTVINDTCFPKKSSTKRSTTRFAMFRNKWFRGLVGKLRTRK